jgi:protease IV
MNPSQYETSRGPGHPSPPPPPPVPPPPGAYGPPPAPGPHGYRQMGYGQPGYRKPRTGIWRTVGLLLFIGMIGFNILFFLVMIGGGGMLGGSRADARGLIEYREDAGYEMIERGPDKVAIIALDGVILDSETGGGLFGGGVNPVSHVRNSLRRASEDRRVRAVILAVNSPGGGITASDVIHNEIRQFRDHHPEKPVVVYMKDLAASGGYYVSAPADHIIASRTTLTGSIGVIMQSFNFHGTLTELLKAREDSITAGDNKAMGSMFADPESERYRESRALLQEMINEMHEQFLRVVEEGRGEKLPDDWRSYADGRILTARQALEIRLVDEIGYMEDAIRKAEELSGWQSLAPVTYGRLTGLAALFGADASQLKPLAGDAEALLKAGIAEQFAHQAREALRLYPDRPMALWIP